LYKSVLSQIKIFLLLAKLILDNTGLDEIIIGINSITISKTCSKQFKSFFIAINYL